MKDKGGPPPVCPPLGPDDIIVKRQPPRLTILAIIFVLHQLRGQTQTWFMEGGWTFLTENQGSSLGTDEAPVAVDMGRGGALLGLD